jgi:hypothetical protein
MSLANCHACRIELPNPEVCDATEDDSSTAA